MTEVGIKRLHPLAQVPKHQRAGDAGADLVLVEPLRLAPGSRGLGLTGLALELPLETMGLVMPRSGLALRHGVTVLNAPGLIDAGYRGEIKVLLINLGEHQVELSTGERIAQLVILGRSEVEFLERTSLSETERGSGGFGHTGNH
jgi:dUTP pyrophosphatase